MKEKIKKIYREKFGEFPVGCKSYEFQEYPLFEEVEEFIFKEIMPKVLKDVCDLEWVEKSYAEYVKVETIKQKAKELYGVDL